MDELPAAVEPSRGARGSEPKRWLRIADNLFRFSDSCHVYLVRKGTTGVLVDFGTGDVLDNLEEVGVERISDVLMTHHHRDQGQGLPRAATEGIRIWVPQAEQELFRQVESHWLSRELDNSYNNRQDRYSLLESVPIAGTLDDYGEYDLGGQWFSVIPTPGHTTGSLTLLGIIDGRKVAFTGDLIAGPGKIWSLAATQWSYNGAEGVAATLASILDLKDRGPELLLPSHGETMVDPPAAISLLADRLWSLLRQRRQNPRLYQLRESPYEPLTPKLLMNRTSLANNYVLLSESGAALFIDFGYDFTVGTAAGSDRASRRPWLYTLPALKRQFGVSRVEVVIPTHHHDDHVAGLNVLRRVEGSEVWAAETFADILEEPAKFDLPCLWYDRIPVDRRLPLETPIRWREHTLTLHHQPGHTRYAVAISFTVDGVKALAVGDQFEGGSEARWNYVYNNGFHPDDYLATAELLDRLRPDLLLAGHYHPHVVDDEFRARVRSGAQELSRLHRELLPVREYDYGGSDRAVRLTPYRTSVQAGARLQLTAEVRNPLPTAGTARLRLVLPPGWRAEPAAHEIDLGPGEKAALTFAVIVSGPSARRRRIAADMSIAGVRLGQQAEALIDVDESSERTVVWAAGTGDAR